MPISKHGHGHVDGYHEEMCPAHCGGRASKTGRVTSTPWNTPEKTVHLHVQGLSETKSGDLKSKVTRPLDSQANVRTGAKAHSAMHTLRSSV